MVWIHFESLVDRFYVEEFKNKVKAFWKMSTYSEEVVLSDKEVTAGGCCWGGRRDQQLGWGTPNPSGRTEFATARKSGVQKRSNVEVILWCADRICLVLETGLGHRAS